MANHLLHQERAAAPWIAAALAATAAALILVDVVTGWGLLGWGLLAGPFVLIVAAFFWGMARYYTIRLTPSRLIVGRAGYAPHDFDPDFGVDTDQCLTDEERAIIESPMPPKGDAEVRLAGGGFGRPIGTKLLVLRLMGDGTRLVVATRHPARFGSLLGDWLVRESTEPT